LPQVIGDQLVAVFCEETNSQKSARLRARELQNGGWQYCLFRMNQPGVVDEEARLALAVADGHDLALHADNIAFAKRAQARIVIEPKLAAVLILDGRVAKADAVIAAVMAFQDALQPVIAVVVPVVPIGTRPAGEVDYLFGRLRWRRCFSLGSRGR